MWDNKKEMEKWAKHFMQLNIEVKERIEVGINEDGESIKLETEKCIENNKESIELESEKGLESNKESIRLENKRLTLVFMKNIIIFIKYTKEVFK